MNISRINHFANIARVTMNNHGLHDWKLKIDNAHRRFGCCKFNSKTITLSRKHLEVSSDEDIIDTILHEIAHALVGINHGHGSVWQAKCLEIGAKPRSCKSANERFHEDAPYVASCEPCKNKWQRYKKPPTTRTYRCPKCRQEVVFVRQLLQTN